MKIKRLFSVLGLGFFAFAAVGAGLVGAKAKKAESVKADGEKWMVTISFDNSNPEKSESWGYIDNQQVRFWGTGVSYDTVHYLHSTGRDHFYTVNVVFTSGQSVDGMQIRFDEEGVAKQSQDITISLDSSCNGRAYAFTFPKEVSWSDGKWSVENNGYCIPSANFGETNPQQLDFEPDPDTASYHIKNVVLADDTFYVNLCTFSYVKHQWDDTYAAIREEASYFSEYFYSWYGEHWVELKSGGTYDIFFTNEFKEGGVIDVKKHAAEEETFIYYVTNSADTTTDYIYAWGGEEQFGEFPGTSIASLVAADKAEELTGNGVVHFQGGETAKLIYRINISKGYPVGDSMFMFDNGTMSYKSAERAIVNEHAYWWTGDANYDAAQAIQFIELLEAYRNKVSGSSVCDMIVEDATFLVNQYNGTDETIRTTYIDDSTIYTYADKTRTTNTLVTVKKIMIELGRIAGIPVVGVSSSNYLFTADINGSNIVLIISVVALVSVSSLSLLIVLKKRKHN